MPTAILVAEKIPLSNPTTKYDAHCFRTEHVPNVLPEYQGLSMEEGPNKVLIDNRKPGLSSHKFIKNKISELNIKPRKNAVGCIDIMTTFTLPDEFKGYGKIPDKYLPDMKKWEELNQKWLEDTFGKENIIYAVVHYDETVPHLHALVMPVVDEKLNASHYLNKMTDYHKFRENYCDYVKEVGLDKGVSGTRIPSQRIQQFYKDIGINYEKSLPEPEPKETPAHYKERVNKIYQGVLAKVYKLTSRVDILTEQNRALQENQEREIKRETDKKISHFIEENSKDFEMVRTLEDVFSKAKKSPEEVDNILMSLSENLDSEEDVLRLQQILAELEELAKKAGKGKEKSSGIAR